jgi:DNA-binding MarR family transcriptional regulator
MNNQLFEKTAHLQRLMHKGFIHGHPTDNHTRGQGRILAALKLKDNVSTKDLAYILGIRTSSLNEFLAKLEKNGYITRDPSDHDKRVILAKITNKGREESPPEPPEMQTIFDCLSEDEKIAFESCLDKIIADLQTKYGSDDREHQRFGHHGREFGGHHGDMRGFGKKR